MPDDLGQVRAGLDRFYMWRALHMSIRRAANATAVSCSISSFSCHRVIVHACPTLCPYDCLLLVNSVTTPLRTDNGFTGEPFDIPSLTPDSGLPLDTASNVVLVAYGSPLITPKFASLSNPSVDLCQLSRVIVLDCRAKVIFSVLEKFLRIVMIGQTFHSLIVR